MIYKPLHNLQLTAVLRTFNARNINSLQTLCRGYYAPDPLWRFYCLETIGSSSTSDQTTTQVHLQFHLMHHGADSGFNTASGNTNTSSYTSYTSYTQSFEGR